MHKKLKLNCILLGVFFISLNLNSQVTMNSSGNTAVISAGSFDYSIGEILVSTGTAQNVIVTQGVLQRIAVYALSIQEKTFDIQTNIFPNPTSEELNIDINTEKNVHVNFRLMDLAGRVLNDFEVKSLSGDLSQKINMSHLANGQYILNINILTKSGNSNQSIHQIIKN